ncbi:putative sialin-like protein [Leptotrombidium deliense]|uniref:Putative sialin-like protein n=1 Tax=Leptotrombidium deliense TaxID=299467 RepID=A0A443RXA7_9ACAR|nr:putative sialin-like protein [Leptotrombidium deliense]
MFLYGCIGGGELPIGPEFAPKYSATVFGFANFFASVTGILAPLLVGLLLDENVNITFCLTEQIEIHDKERWNIVFNTCAALATFGLLFFSIFATSEPKKWA